MFILSHFMMTLRAQGSVFIKNYLPIVIYFVICQVFGINCDYLTINAGNEDTVASSAASSDLIYVNKCCEKFEVISELRCTHVNQTNSEAWKPVFSDDDENTIQVNNFKFLIGVPACDSRQSWAIYAYPGSYDKLVLLENGMLRHYINRNYSEYDEELQKPRYHDYNQGQYCMDMAVSTTSTFRKYVFAKVCSPERELHWSNTDFLLRKIINPIFHAISIMLFVLVAVVYFVLPTLRDLVGNIVTTISLCLAVSQIADLIGIFTEFSSHVSFMVADTVLYVSLLAAFFWLNSFGFYIWKTFRSRNVFLRVTDGRKYCWYSGYAWSLTGLLAAMAIFAHNFLDITSSQKIASEEDEQETIGWLGILIFFTPIAISILVNIFFYVTTLKLINRRNVYGRIQHKLKSNFVMYSLLLLIMSVCWLFLILSWLKYDGIFYTHIFVNAFQGPCVLYICVLRQSHVNYLLKKSCCYNDPPTSGEWGDEMHYMNGGGADY